MVPRFRSQSGFEFSRSSFMLLCVHKVDQQSINKDDRIYHLDYAYSDDDSGPPSFWYYGVQRDFRNLQTKRAPKDAVETCAACWAPDAGCRRTDATWHGEEELGFDMEIPPHYQMAAARLPRKDFALSAQPTFDEWQEMSADAEPTTECEHFHFVSATEFVLVTGTSEWVHPPSSSSRGPNHLPMPVKVSHTQFHQMRIDEANSIVHVSRIELPEPPPASNKHFVYDDRRIYLHMRKQGNSCSSFHFCALDWTRQMRVLNAETRQWEEFELDTRNSDFGIVEIVDDGTGWESWSSNDDFCSVRFDHGVLLRMTLEENDHTNGIVYIQFLPVQRSYIMRRLFKGLSFVEVDPRGSLIGIDDGLTSRVHIYASPPSVAPLRYLAYWKLREMKQTKDGKKCRKLLSQQNPAQNPHERFAGAHDGRRGAGRDQPQRLRVRIIDASPQGEEKQRALASPDIVINMSALDQCKRQCQAAQKCRCPKQVRARARTNENGGVDHQRRLAELYNQHPGHRDTNDNNKIDGKLNE
uniref:F-box associated domain-containing protein n=1 Tax=Globodera rostochiensis TaxID=31243 RepID=A0A914I0Z4_GLORO